MISFNSCAYEAASEYNKLLAVLPLELKFSYILEL